MTECAWCHGTDGPFAAVQTRTGVCAIIDGVTIHHTLCQECLAAKRHIYPPYEEDEISEAAKVAAKIMGPPTNPEPQGDEPMRQDMY